MSLLSAIGSFRVRIPVRALPVRTLAAVSVAGIGLVLASLAIAPEQWMVEHVVFEGQHQASIPELRHLADLPNGTPIWSVDLEKIEADVAAHPWVKTAEAELLLPWQLPPERRRWSLRGPTTVRITVRERTAVALLHGNDRLLCVDEEGEPFMPASAAELDLPHLVGFGPELARLHPQLPRRAIRSALWLVDALDARGLVSRDLVSELDFDRTAGILLVAGPARITFGLSDLPSEVDRLAALVERGVSLDRPTAIDLASATVALVRPLDSTPPSPALPEPRG